MSENQLFNVRVPFSGYADFLVEAESKEDAIDLVFSEDELEINLSVADPEYIDHVEIKDWDLHEKISKKGVCGGVGKASAKAVDTWEDDS